ncbi:hypothetical protein FI667_g4508, partial [Globisporangium splendens]
MGCCPSRCRRVKRDACSDASTTEAAAPAIAVLKERLESNASSIFNASTTESSADLLTHQNDSAAILPSTLNESLEIELHAFESAPVVTKEADIHAVVVDENAERDIRNAEPTMPEMPPESLTAAVAAPVVVKAQPLPSPRKAAVNYDDVPINSMYHRIHIVQAEEQDARRQQELRAEHERHEQEIREFKAAMLALQPK